MIYKGPEVNSYKWGYTDNNGTDHYIPAADGGERFYCDFMALDPAYEYWVETSYDSRVNCVTRSYYSFESNKSDEAGTTGDFTIYPVPASDKLTVRFGEDASPSGIAIYNLMMQKVYESAGPDASQNEYTISLERFKSGIYIIRISDDSDMSNFRVFTIEK
jgi:hypothetical protein